MVWIIVDHDKIINSEKIVEISWECPVTSGKAIINFYSKLCGENIETTKSLLFTKDIMQSVADYVECESKKRGNMGFVSEMISPKNYENKLIEMAISKNANVILNEIFSQIAIAKSRNQDAIIDLNKEVKIS
ncbi:hypothetical protein [Methanoregula sp.]|uniref:hypothetical protein n=1 Tax=Methanoregula sp. TaxID=2052170 RepID=UPI0035650BF2